MQPSLNSPEVRDGITGNDKPIYTEVNMLQEENKYNSNNVPDSFEANANDIIQTIKNALTSIETIPEFLQQAENTFNSIIDKLSAIKDINIDDLMKKISNQEVKIEDGVFAWGNAGWCLYGFNYDISFAGLLTILNEASMNENGNPCSIEELDAFAMDFIKQCNIVEKINKSLKNNLSKDDWLKYKSSFDDYESKRYYNAAIVLCAIIDSLSIKQAVDDIDNGITQPNQNGEINLTNGWKCFYHVYNNHFEKKLCSLSISKGKEDTIKQNIKSVETKRDNYFKACGLANEILCILQIFNGKGFIDYKNKKPAVINRNWLAHGMYTLDDITEVDCIKLILILDQLSRLYSTINNINDEEGN